MIQRILASILISSVLCVAVVGCAAEIERDEQADPAETPSVASPELTSVVAGCGPLLDKRCCIGYACGVWVDDNPDRGCFCDCF